MVFQSKQDASYRHNVLEKLELLSGRVVPKMDLGVEFMFTDGREMTGRVFSRADQGFCAANGITHCLAVAAVQQEPEAPVVCFRHDGYYFFGQ
ncbi:hypothetical protein BBP00_00003100 [Phytophthora kernoviae]|uniref:Uncharacterized protein n=1 Tax=Phytophthora kernoviae TaxID=325452 RepID=A0A3F2RVH3_9STRA|nr:hypothetical protein BBP00_00003100 [Phytophthora kernoviae]